MANGFEYQILRPEHLDTIDGDRTILRLNELASEGWRVAAAITHSEPMGVAHATYSFTGSLLLERSRDGV